MEVGTTVRRGRCNNVGMCENAVFQRPITVPDGEPFVCPQCLGELTDVRERQTAHKPSRVVVPLAVLSVAVAVAGYAAWREYGAPHAAAPALSAASVAPAASGGAGPAPAGTQSAALPPSAAPAGSPSAPAQVVPVPLASNPPVEPAQSAATPATPTVAPPAGAQAEAMPIPGQAADSAGAPGQVAQQAPPAALQSSATPAPVSQAPPAPATALAAPPAQAPNAEAPAATDAATPPSASVPGAAVPTQAVRSFLGDAKPVPVTFHFRPNSVLLNSHGDHDVAHLVAYLAAHHASGAEVYLAGFTDNLGSPEGNLAFSKRRVATVVAALAAAGVKPAHVASFGADMPVADNATPRGREENRRVEVYLGQ